MAERTCLRCGAVLKHITRDTIQLGKTDWLLGDLPNLLSGGLEVEIMSCPACGQIAFFQPDDDADDASPSGLHKTCPQCGKKHHFADRRCPACGYEYY